MSEAFVKTFKRDYGYLSDLPDVKMVPSSCRHGSRSTTSGRRKKDCA